MVALALCTALDSGLVAAERRKKLFFTRHAQGSGCVSDPEKALAFAFLNFTSKGRSRHWGRSGSFHALTYRCLALGWFLGVRCSVPESWTAPEDQVTSLSMTSSCL